MTREPVASRISIVAVWLGQLLLLAMNAASALVPLGALNVAANLSISFVKAALIASFFMHLRVRSGLVRTVAVAGLFWLALLMGLSLADYLTRSNLSAPW